MLQLLHFSNTETANNTKYVGMRVVITAGTGAGQYGFISPIISVQRLQILQKKVITPGWETWHPN